VKIIIGLGNPGPEYALTRHNTGVMLVDKIYQSKFMNYEYGFRRKKDIFVYESDTLVLVKTAKVFMNESGKIIFELKHAGFFNNSTSPLAPFQNFREGKRSEGLYVVHDDLDIKLGEYKIQFGIGPKEHNGVNSIEQTLGTKDFWRIRIGIDNRQEIRDTKYDLSGEQYVLQKFAPEEREIIEKVLDEVCTTLLGSPS